MTAGREPGDGPGSAQEVPRRPRTRWLAARVVAVQLVTLIALWWLQSTYGGG